MNKIQSRPNRPVSIQKAASPAPESDAALNAILRDVFHTREVQQFLIKVVSEFMNV